MKESEREKQLASHGNRCAATETVCKAAGGKLTGEVFARAIDDNLRTAENAWRAWLEKGSREDISTQVEQISVPVSVAAGELDKAMTPKLLQREVVRRIEGAKLIIVPKVRHLLPLEVPAAVANLIREHCENLRDDE